MPYYKPLSDKDETLVFESRFESGNLDLAIKISEAEYNLILQNDSLSHGHTQWFYFKVSNTRKGKQITFNILNFVLLIVIVVKKELSIQQRNEDCDAFGAEAGQRRRFVVQSRRQHILHPEQIQKASNPFPQHRIQH